MDEPTTGAVPGRVGSFALGRDLGERLVFGGLTIIVNLARVARPLAVEPRHP